MRQYHSSAVRYFASSKKLSGLLQITRNPKTNQNGLNWRLQHYGFQHRSIQIIPTNAMSTIFPHKWALFDSTTHYPYPALPHLHHLHHYHTSTSCYGMSKLTKRSRMKRVNRNPRKRTKPNPHETLDNRSTNNFDYLPPTASPYQNQNDRKRPPPTRHRRKQRGRRVGVSSSTPSSSSFTPSSSSFTPSSTKSPFSLPIRPRKTDSKINTSPYYPIRLHKMERRLTHKLTQYYEKLGIPISNFRTPHDQINETNYMESNIKSAPHTHFDDHHTNTSQTNVYNHQLPYYSSISTQNLSSALLHPPTPPQTPPPSKLKLLETEQLYVTLQKSIKQLMLGWESLDHFDNTDDIDDTYHIIKSQYPIRAEVWLDKMEELRWERYKMIQKHQQIQSKPFQKISSLLSNFVQYFSNNDHDNNGNFIDSDSQLVSHLTTGPNTELYIGLAETYKMFFFERLKKNKSDLNISFLSAKATTKRMEHLIEKCKLSRERGNPKADPNKHNMALYEQVLNHYANIGAGINPKKADLLGQQLIQHGQHFRKEAHIIRLVMNIYSTDLSNSYEENTSRMEELLFKLKQLEKKYNLPLGVLATPLAYQFCCKAYLNVKTLIPNIEGRADKLFSEMSSLNEPDISGYKKAIMEKHLIIACNTIMSIFLGSKEIYYINKAESILQFMEESYTNPSHTFQIPPNTSTFNTLLKGFLKRTAENPAAIAQKGTSLLDRMYLLPDAQPSYRTYLYILRLWNRSGSPDAGMQSEMIFSKMEFDSILRCSKNEDLAPMTNVRMYTSLIKNWGVAAKHNFPGAARRAHDLLRRMEVESGMDTGIDPKLGESVFCDKSLQTDSKTYANVIGVCGNVANPEEHDEAIEIAFETYSRMIERGIRPETVVMLRCITQLVPAAQSIKRSMLARKIMEIVAEQGKISNDVKGALRHCSPQVYDDYFGDKHVE